MAQYNSYREQPNAFIGTDKYGNNAPKRAPLSCINDNLTKYHVLSKDNIWRPETTDLQPSSQHAQPLKFQIFDDNKMHVSTPNSSPKLPKYVMKLYKEEYDSKENDSWVPAVSPDELENKRVEQRWVAPYKAEVYNYLKERETINRPNVTRMRKQKDITSEMRTVLVDWMTEVAEEYKFQEETIHLAVLYTDRFLSSMSVQRSYLQLVGTTALFVASKHHEIYAPELKDFVYITDSTYTKKDILRMEQMLLKSISFDLSAPTAHSFLQVYANMASSSDTVLLLAQYICNISLLHTEMLLFLPSEIGASCLAIANSILDAHSWPRELEELSGYSMQDIKVVTHCLFSKYKGIQSLPQRVVYDKYRGVKFQRVACIQCPSGLDL